MSQVLARALRTPVAWIAFYLLLLDLAANLFFAYPKDPRDIQPSKVRQYFEYGRSVEGKLTRMTRATDEAGAPIVTSGWLDSVGEAEVARTAAAGRPVVTFYGMSHAQLLAEDVARVDPTLAIRAVAAPLAVPTWAFAAFERDRKAVHSDVAVLAVMTNTIPLMLATTGGTMYFDGAYPYTWPRYLLEGDALRAIDPPFTSVAGYRRFFFDPVAWGSYREWLARYDKFYDPLLFRRTILDRSALLRLLRRSYALAARSGLQAKVYDDLRGFDPASEEAKVLAAIVKQFARDARASGSVPMLYVVNNLNTGEHAFRLVAPELQAEAIPYLSSHEVVSPSDPRNYLADSHFEPEKNKELAVEMARRIHERLSFPR